MMTIGGRKLRAIICAAILAIVVGALLFYSTDNPFQLAFVAGAACVLLGMTALIVATPAALLSSRRRLIRLLGWLGLSVSTLIMAVALIALLDYRLFFFHTLSKSEWQSDLRYLSRTIEQNHPAPFAHETRGAFEAAVASEGRDIAGQTNAGIVMQLTRLVASLHDGHSALFPFQPATGFHMIPLQLSIFSDGIYVTDASPAYRSLVGMKLTDIANLPVVNAYARMAPFVGTDNAVTVEDRIPLYLLCPEALQAVGIIDNPDAVLFGFLDDTGHRIRATLRPAGLLRYFYWYFAPLAEWKYKTDESAWPLYRHRPWDNYWFTWDPAKRLLFFEFRQVRNNAGESFGRFGDRLLKFAASHPVEKFVVDLRWNSGGDNSLVAGFVDGLSRDARLNRRGHLFVLIGPHTFSAAVNLTTMLENETEAVFVGAPTGAGPNHFGDPKHYFLPRSKMFVLIASRREEFGDVADKRDAHRPDVPATMSHRDYFTGRDPALEAALRYEGPRPEMTLDPASASRYAGRYAYDSDRTLDVNERHGALQFEIADFMRLQLRAVSADAFHTHRDGPKLAFVQATDRAHDAVDWQIGSETRVLPRLPDGFLTPHELLANGRAAESAAAYRLLRRRNPGDAAVSEQRLSHWGYARLRAGRPDQAIAMFRLAVEFYPRSTIACERLADAEVQVGDRLGARKDYRRALMLDPENSEAKESLAQIGD